ncbi:hypothetical protein Q5M85_00795 [Paraclostridium bifermentans]|nr:hypothetical protein [Paraclostridium bifermentans]
MKWIKLNFLNYTNKKLKNQVNISKNWALRKVLEKPLEIISRVLIVPPIVFTGIMVFGMLILSLMSWFSISYFPDFIQNNGYKNNNRNDWGYN